VLDIETAAATTEDLWQGVQTWLDTVQAATGLPPILYMSPGFADENDAPVSLITYPLWVAEYGVAEPTLPQGWINWLLWQSSESGTVNGVTGSVDLDQINGSLLTLQALAKM
jgi:lysozyme